MPKRFYTGKDLVELNSILPFVNAVSETNPPNLACLVFAFCFKLCSTRIRLMRRMIVDYRRLGSATSRGFF